MTEEKKRVLAVYDFKQEFKSLFSPSAKEPEIVEVPALKYMMVDGQGYPGTSKEFAEKVQLLYGLAYTIKFMLKKEKTDAFDFKVPPLSGLWHAEDMAAYIDAGRKEEWLWTLMLALPERVTNEVFLLGKGEFIKKKQPRLMDAVSFNVYEEGLCAQIMHIGPYSAETETIARLHGFFQEKGYTFNGRHHEIYLGDPRKAQPEKLKTIIRQPIKQVLVL